MIKKDREEEASLHQNLYLVNVYNKNYDEALKECDECISILTELHGERSKKIAGKWYQKANCHLFLARREEAIAAIGQAIDLHENPSPDKDAVPAADAEVDEKKAGLPEKETNFNRIQY